MMSDKVYSKTGSPMVDFLFSGYAMMLDMQRRAMTGENLPLARATIPYARRQDQRDETRSQATVGATEEQVIPLIREELRIGKRQVQRAKAYRVSSTVVEVPVEQQINLRAETVVIERRPASGTTVHGGQTFENRTIEVHEIYEEPVVGKVIMQPEEVVIYKTLSERTAIIRDTVRETRVNVEEQAIEIPRNPQINGEATARFEAEFKPTGDDKPETVRDMRVKMEEQAVEADANAQAHAQANGEDAARLAAGLPPADPAADDAKSQQLTAADNQPNTLTPDPNNKPKAPPVLKGPTRPAA